MPQRRKETRVRGDQDELLYRRINQLSAVQLAVGTILVLLLAIVAILLAGADRRANARLTALERRIDALAEQLAGAAAPTAGEPPPPVPAPTEEAVRESDPPDQPSDPSPPARKPPPELRAALSLPHDQRDGAWRDRVRGLLDTLAEEARDRAPDPTIARLGVRAALASADLDRAAWWCDRLRSVDPAVQESARVAELGLSAGAFPTALRFAVAATDGPHVQPDALLVRARIEDKLGRPDARDRTLNRALQFAGTAARALTQLAPNLIAGGRTDDLARAIETVRRVVPTDEAVAREALTLALARGDLDAGLAEYSSMKPGDARSVALAHALGRALLGATRYRDALRIWADVVRRDPDDAGGFDAMGTALLALMHTDEAVAAFERATGLDGTDVGGWYHLGVARADGGDLDGAVEALGEALKRDDTHARSHFVTAVCLARMGKADDAEAALARALALDPTLVQAATAVPALERMLAGTRAEPTRPDPPR